MTLRQLRYFGVFLASFEHISHIVLMFTLLSLDKQMPTGTKFKTKFPQDQLLIFSSLLYSIILQRQQNNTQSLK